MTHQPDPSYVNQSQSEHAPRPPSFWRSRAGIYLIAPSARGLVPTGRRYDMTDLIGDLIAGGKRVVGFPVPEYWLDVGQMADYEKAQAHIGGESAQN